MEGTYVEPFIHPAPSLMAFLKQKADPKPKSSNMRRNNNNNNNNRTEWTE